MLKKRYNKHLNFFVSLVQNLIIQFFCPWGQDAGNLEGVLGCHHDFFELLISYASKFYFFVPSLASVVNHLVELEIVVIVDNTCTDFNDNRDKDNVNIVN